MSNPADAARSFVKWAGGKQALCEQIAERFPKHKTYYEPFLGGGSVFFALRPTAAVLGDENAWLMDTYRAIRDDWESVATALDAMRNTKSEFHRIRGIPPESLPLAQRAAQFIFLNKTCFRGLFRVNRHGQFNVPYGAYDRRYYDRDNLHLVSQSLASVRLRATDFELTLQDVTADDFVYLDPPYYKLGGYSDFNRYTRTQFRATDHIRLAAVCRELNARGIRWLLSNSDTPFVRSLYDGFRIACIEARREINLRSRERHIVELLISNYD
jgi:DNA adenine methylase